jgi:hypothetical protein
MQILGKPISNLAVLKDRYDSFSFSEDETTSGINIIYNMLLPNIYILFLYELPISKGYHDKLYMIVVAYLVIRYCFLIFILGRISLLNFRYELTLIILALAGTYLVYRFIILNKISMFIPIEEFKNEIVLLLLLFLYDVFKNGLVKLFNNRDTTTKRSSYIRNRFSFFKSKYGSLISDNIKNDPFTQSFESIKNKNLFYW